MSRRKIVVLETSAKNRRNKTNETVADDRDPADEEVEDDLLYSSQLEDTNRQ